MSSTLDALRKARELVVNAVGRASFRFLQSAVEQLAPPTPKALKKFKKRERDEIRPKADVLKEQVTTAIAKVEDQGPNLKEFEELDADGRKLAATMPKVECEVRGVCRDEPEIEMLSGIRGVTVVPGEGLRVDSPVDVVIGLLKFIADGPDDPVEFETYLDGYAHVLRKGADLESTKQALRRLSKESESLRRDARDILSAALHAAYFCYGLSFRRLESPGVYQTGPEFYSNAGNGVTLTCATSSGLVNPYEFLGTDEFCNEFKVAKEHLKAAGVKLTAPNRKQNFEKGILNSAHNCHRIYALERRGASKSLQKVYDCLSQDGKSAFRRRAVEILDSAMGFQRLQLVMVEEFKPWMSRYTRVGENIIMVSYRGPESKEIVHASFFQNVERVPSWLDQWNKVYGVAGFCSNWATGLSAIDGSLQAVKAFGLTTLALLSAWTLFTGGRRALGVDELVSTSDLVRRLGDSPEKLGGIPIRRETHRAELLIEDLLSKH